MRRVIAPRGQVAHLSRSKYGVRTDPAGKLARTVDGICFDSKAEAKRYGQLKLLLKAGEIRDLETHPRYVLFAEGGARPVGIYEADFRYDGVSDGRSVVEDVKGVDTPLSRWKRRHVEAQYGVKVQVIR